MVAVAWSQDTADPPGTNIALGASYTLEPAPNYGVTSDAADYEQLTDGVHFQTQESLWGQLSTVGWQDRSPVIVTLDLGTVMPIRGVLFHTAAGRAGVSWPQEIRILTAGEDGQFHEIGNLVALSAQHSPSPSLTEYGVHRFVTDELRTHGRFVRLIVWNEPFTFVDEIEVYVGEPEWVDEPLPGPAIADLWAYLSRTDIEDPSENIAVGASYTLEPGPNYGLTSDAADYEQLTDGVHLQTQESIWGQLSTVGWQEKSPVTVTLDLGAVMPIRGVSFHTAAGRAGVTWPQAIRILTAGEDGQFHEIADLVELSAEHSPSPSLTEYAVHRFFTDQLRTHGRFVGFVVWNEPFTFVDEIEVYMGEPEWLDEQLPGLAIAGLRAFVSRTVIDAGIRTRLQRDIEAMREAAQEEGIPVQARNDALAELSSVEGELGQGGEAFGDDFRAVLPLNSQHERVMRTQAWLWRAKGLEPLTFWRSHLWDPLPLIGTPTTAGELAVEVHLMRREYRAAAFNISSSNDEPMQVRFLLSGLPGGDNPEYVTVHEVAWTDTRRGVPVAAALPEVDAESDLYTVSVPSGMTRQVWLTFHPVDVTPGSYEGEVVVESVPGGKRFPLRMHLYPLDFPEKQSLHFGGWDYTDVVGHFPYVTEQNRLALIQHLREHLVDSPWGLPRALPRGTHDETGAMTAPPDTDHFDAWIDLWPDAAQYLVFAKVGDQFESWTMGTPEFTTAVKDWVQFWAEHAVTRGVRPEQLALLLVDEPDEPWMDERILAWAQAIREAGTGVRIWEDVNHEDMNQANQEMIDACHVLCPNYQAFLTKGEDYRDYFVDKRDQGIGLEFYTAWPGRVSDPYAGRLMAWTGWRYRATAIYMWSLGDTAGASSWNEYLAFKSTYAPLFLDEDSITAGKHLEAVREGVEDYEYFAMLDRAIQEASAQGMPGPGLEEARQLLESLPASVTAAAGQRTDWLSENVDRTLADEARIRVLAQLAALSAMTAVTEEPVVLPHEFSLEQSFPNPFNPITTIGFAVPARGDVELVIYNLAGQQARTLVSAVVEVGNHSVTWDGRDDLGRELASGVYMYRLQAGERVASRRFLLLK